MKELLNKVETLEKRVAELEEKLKAKTTQEFTENEIMKLKKIAQKYFG